MRQSASIFLLSLLSTINFTHAQTPGNSAPPATPSPNGLIVPFTSGLPPCASFCGPLFDVQGKCTPPNIPTTDDNCFCTDTRLTNFNNAGTEGVSAVCGPQSCTNAADLQAIKTWYDNFCATKNAVISSTTTAATGAASTGKGTNAAAATAAASQTWIQGHYRWVIMLVVIFFSIVGGWIGAYLLRRRYIRKREKEIEMLPPVATGPHQLQAMTGGYSNGVFNNSRGTPGHSKESSSIIPMVASPGRTNAKRESQGWLRKSRF